MNIGIIQTKENQYYIQKTDTTYKVKCISKDRVYTLTKDETKELLKDIFSSEMKKIGEEDQLTIYEDSAKNLRFFENGEENFLYFFYYNGSDALLYQGKFFGKKGDDDDDIEKIVHLDSKRYGPALLILTLEFVWFAGVLASNGNIPEFPKEEYYFLSTTQMTANEFMEELRYSLKDILSDEQIDYLCNKDLFEDVLKIATPTRKQVLLDAVRNLRFTYFTDRQKTKRSESQGYYSVLIDQIALRDDSEYIFDTSAAHELVHLLQANGKYYYIHEACAEIVAYEYFGSPKIAYEEESNKILALMELIGPQPVFECCFKGDESSFEKEIYDHLSPEEAKEFLGLLKHSPAYNNNIKEANERIEELILKIYKNIHHQDGTKDLEFSAVLKGRSKDRYYFNTHHDLYNQDFSILVTQEEYPMIPEENVNCYIREIIYKITEEEYKELSGDPFNKIYVSYKPIEGYYIVPISEDDYVVSDGEYYYSKEDAIKKGYLIVAERQLHKKNFYYTLDEYEMIKDSNPADYNDSVVEYKDTLVRKDNYEEYEIKDIDHGTIRYIIKNEFYKSMPSMREKFPDQMNFDKKDEKVY